MTKEDPGRHFHIPMDVLDEYAKAGFCSKVKNGDGAWQYDDTDLGRITNHES